MIEPVPWLARTFSFNEPVAMASVFLTRLRAMPVRAADLVANVPEHLLGLRTDTKWSAKEHLGHLADLQPLDEQRLGEFLAGAMVLSPADMKNRATETAKHNEQPMADLLARLRDTRREWVQKLESLSESDFGRVALHPRLQQQMRLVDWLQFIAEHDGHHLAKVAQLVDDLEAVRYPVGRCVLETDSILSKRPAWIQDIRELPSHLRSAVSGLTDEHLSQCYRTGGWTIRQVVHHLADEHLNAFAYFKMALTEDTPTIKHYDEPKWSEMPDACAAPIGLSLDLLTALHARWAFLLASLDDTQLQRGYVHRRGLLTLNDAIQLYSWHSRHHTAHILSFRSRNGL